MVPDITEAVVAGDVSTLNSVMVDTPAFEWPNDVMVVPDGIFDERAIVVPDGFIPPGKNNGNIYIVTMDPVDLTKSTATY